MFLKAPLKVWLERNNCSLKRRIDIAINSVIAWNIIVTIGSTIIVVMLLGVLIQKLFS